MSHARLIDRRAFGLGLGGTVLAGRASAADTRTQPGAVTRTAADSMRRMTVPVRLNGKGPFDFVLDTGANRTVISRELAAELGLPEAGTVRVHGVAGAEMASTVRVDSLDLAGLAAGALRMPALDGARLRADGLLGVDVLRERRVLMDFRGGVLTIDAARGRDRDSTFQMRQEGMDRTRYLGQRVRVPARYRFGQLMIVAADAGRQPVTAFLDSGAQSTVGNTVLRQRLIDKSRLPGAVRLEAPVLGVTGQQTMGELRLMPLLKIGNLRISGMQTIFADLHVFDIWELGGTPSLLLGMDVLNRFNAVELNYAGREVAFYLPA